MNVSLPKAVRAGVLYLAASSLVVGLWATFDPRGFYDGFPGGGRHWVAGDGPYNAHLTGDAGVGFLAVGVVLLLAAVWTEKRLTQGALVAAVVHGAPHLLFHLRNPNDALGSLDAWLSNGGLFLGTALAVVLLVATGRARHFPAEDAPEAAPAVAARTSHKQPTTA